MINKVPTNPFICGDEYSITDVVETLNEVVDELNKLLKQQEEVTEPHKYEDSMLKEDAKKMLRSKMDGHTDASYEWAETVRMAIKALEQPSIEEWLSSFNTESAPQCFNAVQELKKKVGFNE